VGQSREGQLNRSRNSRGRLDSTSLPRLNTRVINHMIEGKRSDYTTTCMYITHRHITKNLACRSTAITSPVAQRVQCKLSRTAAAVFSTHSWAQPCWPCMSPHPGSPSLPSHILSIREQIWLMSTGKGGQTVTRPHHAAISRLLVLQLSLVPSAQHICRTALYHCSPTAMLANLPGLYIDHAVVRSY